MHRIWLIHHAQCTVTKSKLIDKPRPLKRGYRKDPNVIRGSQRQGVLYLGVSASPDLR